MAKGKVLILVGPTASGKSALAVELARKFNGEVVSGDSRQVYKGLDIGTGKITKKERRGVRHYLLDVASPNETFTANDFVEKGRAAIQRIVARGKLPIVSGGSGFYIDALLGRIALPDVPADANLRTRLKKRSAAQLFELLKKKDSHRAKTIDRHNKVRIIRALEIIETLGHVPRHEPYPLSNDTLWIGIAAPKDELRKKIRVRLEARMRRGMLREARRLHAKGVSYKRMETFGLEYRALALLLQGKTTRAETLIRLEFDIRHYAKRQLTYWKRNKNIKWFKPSQKSAIARYVRTWLN